MNLDVIFQEKESQATAIEPTISTNAELEEKYLTIKKNVPPKKNKKTISKPRAEKKNDRDYVDKETFFNAIKDYFEARDKAQSEGKTIKIPDNIGIYMKMIATKIFTSNKFYGSRHLLDDLISVGVIDALKGLKQFDLARNEKNPFGYFSQAIYRAGLRKIYAEVNEAEGRRSLISNDYTEIADMDENCDIQRQDLLDWYDTRY